MPANANGRSNPNNQGLATEKKRPLSNTAASDGDHEHSISESSVSSVAGHRSRNSDDERDKRSENTEPNEQSASPKVDRVSLQQTGVQEEISTTKNAKG
ncbi:MAG: hypothetical protein MI861_27775, partial [Pirellulales bacterium]|nr:hypothetical protein [Pirellulales bacterium]